MSQGEEDPKPAEDEYVAGLSYVGKRVQAIAIEVLGSSYSLERSNGYRQWQTERDRLCASNVDDAPEAPEGRRSSPN